MSSSYFPDLVTSTTSATSTSSSHHHVGTTSTSSTATNCYYLDEYVYTSTNEQWNALPGYFETQDHCLVICRLCETSEMNRTLWRSHCFQPQHQQRVASLKLKQHDIKAQHVIAQRWNDAKLLELRVAQNLSNCAKWQNEVRLALYHGMMHSAEVNLGISHHPWRSNTNNASTATLSSNNNEMIQMDPLRDAKKKLRQYEQMERLSLLELAIWKIVVCLNHPSKPLTDYIEICAWQNEGWKRNKPQYPRQNVSTIHIIMTHVLPFLGKY